MQCMKYLFVLMITFWMSCAASQAIAQEIDTPFTKQYIEDKFKLREALEAIKEGDYYLSDYRPNYDAALEAYQKAQAVNPNNVELNMKIALCYLYSPTKDHMECMPYYEKALALDPEIEPYIVFYLGEAYHRNRQWNKAIDYYQKHLAIMQEQGDEIEISFAQKRIQECKNGIELAKRPVNIKTENLGEVVNSEYDEYGVVITADESQMYFTSRREGTVGRQKDSDGKYYEDVYISYKQEGTWTRPQNLGPPINSDENDAVVSISADGMSMVLYREGDLYYCKKDEETGQWNRPKSFPGQINTSRFLETSAAFSVTGDTLYFVSNRKDMTRGGLDIFFCIKEGGKDDEWSEPINLGPTINTPYDEDGVFIHPEGHTLYFSSTGHNTMGGYDIFRSELINGTWGAPENIGLPMNTPEDELYLSLSRSGRYGYYSSSSKDGLRGEDIYRVTFLDVPEDPVEVAPKLRPLLAAHQTTTPQWDELTASVEAIDLSEEKYFLGVRFKVFDAETKEPLPATIAFQQVILIDANGDVSTLISYENADYSFGFEAKSKGYLSAIGTANLSAGMTQLIEVPLKKLSAKPLQLALEAQERQALSPILPTPQSIALDEAGSILPLRITLLDATTEELLTQGQVTIRSTDGEIQLNPTWGNQKSILALVPEKEYTLSALAPGYVEATTSLVAGADGVITLRLQPREAKANVLALQHTEAVALPLPNGELTRSELDEGAMMTALKQRIVDAETQKPIANATVVLQNSAGKISLMADPNGYVKTILSTQENLAFEVSAKGYIAQKGTWSAERFVAEQPIGLQPKSARIMVAAQPKVSSPKLTTNLFPELAASELSEEGTVAFFSARILDDATREPILAEIQIVNKDDNKTVATPLQKPRDGAFLSHLPVGENLMIVVEAEGYLYHSENFTQNENGSYTLRDAEILLKKVDVGKSLTLNNVIFKVSSVELQESSYAELDRLANIMKKNPTLVIEISGHTDYTRGRNIEGLMELSLLRAKAVKDYLVEKGIEASRMVEKGYGPNRPVVSHDDPELKYLNRRVEFEILSK